MNNWKHIWEKRKTSLENETILTKLILIDGFDTGYGTIKEYDWIAYVEKIRKKLGITNRTSLYEVGCGAGAFLYQFYNESISVGGLDYSSALIDIAKEYLPKAKLSVGEASNLDTKDQYDYVISNSVFFYFPSYSYAEEVVKKMIDKSRRGIAILEVNDYDKKEESMRLRKGFLSDEVYEEKYKGLEHLYYHKQWFIDIAEQYCLKIEIEQQNINHYKNNIYRFNVFMFKD